MSTAAITRTGLALLSHGFWRRASEDMVECLGFLEARGGTGKITLTVDVKDGIMRGHQVGVNLSQKRGLTEAREEA